MSIYWVLIKSLLGHGIRAKKQDRSGQVGPGVPQRLVGAIGKRRQGRDGHQRGLLGVEEAQQGRGGAQDEVGPDAARGSRHLQPHGRRLVQALPAVAQLQAHRAPAAVIARQCLLGPHVPDVAQPLLAAPVLKTPAARCLPQLLDRAKGSANMLWSPHEPRQIGSSEAHDLEGRYDGLPHTTIWRLKKGLRALPGILHTAEFS